MQSPIQITFRGIEHSEFIEDKIREKAKKLERYYPNILHCHVVIESEHHRHHQGNLFDIRIDISVPDKEIVISRKKHNNHAHENAYVAIRDAFDAARRQLEDYARIHRGDVKSHKASSRGSQAKRLLPEE